MLHFHRRHHNKQCCAATFIVAADIPPWLTSPGHQHDSNRAARQRSARPLWPALLIRRPARDRYVDLEFDLHPGLWDGTA